MTCSPVAFSPVPPPDVPSEPFQAIYSHQPFIFFAFNKLQERNNEKVGWGSNVLFQLSLQSNHETSGMSKLQKDRTGVGEF